MFNYTYNSLLLTEFELWLTNIYTINMKTRIRTVRCLNIEMESKEQIITCIKKKNWGRINAD